MKGTLEWIFCYSALNETLVIKVEEQEDRFALSVLVILAREAIWIAVAVFWSWSLGVSNNFRGGSLEEEDLWDS